MKAALVLVLLENMIQFGFELAHRNIPRFGLTTSLAPLQRFLCAEARSRPKAATPTLTLFNSREALEILIVGIEESNGGEPVSAKVFLFGTTMAFFAAFYSPMPMKLLK
jgi:hypothetical protein